MTACVCGKPGFATRRELAGHIQDDHQVDNPVRALMLADKRMEGKPYTPEECAVLGVEPSAPPVIAPPFRSRLEQATAAVANLGLPSPEEVERRVAELNATSGPTSLHPAPHPAPPRATRRKNLRAAQPKVTPATAEGADDQQRARVAQTAERRPSMADATGSSPVPRSTPTPAPPAIPPVQQEADMAKTLKCPKCDFTSRVQGLSRHLNETHGIKDKAERAALLEQAGAPARRAKKPKVEHGPKSATGGGKKSANTVSRNGGPPLQTILTDARARVGKLREDLRLEEMLVARLEEMAGA